jgi:hypothetical protein
VPRALAISFDFFDTLAHHAGAGRGARLMEYFRANGWTSDGWEHQVLYDVFREHGMQYDPAASVRSMPSSVRASRRRCFGA